MGMGRTCFDTAQRFASDAPCLENRSEVERFELHDVILPDIDLNG
jgi:hypothetical protein